MGTDRAAITPAANAAPSGATDSGRSPGTGVANRLLCDAPAGDGAGQTRGAGYDIGSIQYRASAVLYLLPEHPIDRRGWCRCSGR